MKAEMTSIEVILSLSLEAGSTVLWGFPRRRLMLLSVAVGAPNTFAAASLSVSNHGGDGKTVECGDAAILEEVDLSHAVFSSCQPSSKSSFKLSCWRCASNGTRRSI